MASIQTIADSLGLSKATVCHALKNTGRMSPSTRKRVLQAAKRAGYTVSTELSLSAKRLSKKTEKAEPRRRGFVANLVFYRNTRENVLSAPFYRTLSGRIHDGFREKGYTLMDSYPQDADEFIRILATNSSDGTILISRIENLEQSLVPYLENYAMSRPLIFLGDYPSRCPSRFHAVVADNITIGRAAAEYFIGKGFRDIVFIDPRTGMPVMEERYQGYRIAMDQAGLRCSRLFFDFRKFREDAGYLLDLGSLAAPAAPVAFVCANDLTALDFHKYLLGKGVYKPALHHFSGVDGTPELEADDVRDITLKLDFQGMVRAASHLFEDILSGAVTHAQRVLIGSELMERKP